MATLSTARECPYCGDGIELGDCPLVATSFIGEELRGVEGFDLSGVELYSGEQPRRLLPGTEWPVLMEAPRDARVASIDGRRGRSSIERAFADFSGSGSGGEELPPLHECGVAREDVPARACPRCHFPLPSTIDQRPAIVVAVVGVNAVGKTHLLATSLAAAYRQRGLAAIGCTEFVPDEVTGSRFMQDYYEPLFRRGQVLDLTQAEDREARFKPLVFNVTLADGEPFSLIMHDVAGEIMGDHRVRARSATYLHGARGIVFVVDPRDIDDLRDGVVGLMPEGEELGWDQGTLLAACLRPDGMLDRPRPTPLAVAIAKADVLPQATGASLPFLAPAPDGEDEEGFYRRIRTTSDQVEEFLERYRAHNILGPAREYEERLRAAGGQAAVTFHAFSALGRSPVEIENGGGKVQPVNCLDPLAAILSQV